MDIKKTNTYYDFLLKENQISQISSTGKIQAALKKEYCIGYFACEDESIVGFALLREYEEQCFFLWNSLIDSRHQGCGKGKSFLCLLLDTLKNDYYAKTVTTTYIWGNDIAKKLYESTGFIQTDIICEGDIHEVNMILSLRS